MISSCANPACQVPFDYRQGAFFRFHKSHGPDEQPPNTHSVQHFWLCAKCSRDYTLIYAQERGVLLQNRSAIEPAVDECRFVATA
ncbi:MAG: hypothetical protein WCE50_12595 [Candidatus Acidiferrum sp.]